MRATELLEYAIEYYHINEIGQMRKTGHVGTYFYRKDAMTAMLLDEFITPVLRTADESGAILLKHLFWNEYARVIQVNCLR